MKQTLAGVLLFLCLCINSFGQDEVNSIVQCHFGDGFCTGVCVDSEGIILTAKHCGANDVIECTVPGRAGRIRAIKVAETSDPEGTLAYDLEGAGYNFVSVASNAPQVGENVWSLGHPSGGPLQRDEGVILRGNRIVIWGNVAADFEMNTTDLHKVWPGWSGGPLFNKEGQVLGLLSSFNAQFDDQGNLTEPATESNWITYTDVRKVYTQAVGDSTEVIVFTADWCVNCRKLKRDVDGGKFPGYSFTFVEYYEKTNTYSDPAAFARFEAETGQHPDLGLPVIWVPGSGKYTTGYSTGRPLINFLEGVVGFIFNGPPKRIPKRYVPTPQSELTPVPEDNGASSALAEIKNLKEMLAEQASKTAADIKALKEGNILQKAAAAKSLLKTKNEVQSKLGEVSKKVEEGAEASKAFKDNPYNIFAIIIGLIGGPLKRRFA